MILNTFKRFSAWLNQGPSDEEVAAAIQGVSAANQATAERWARDGASVIVAKDGGFTAIVTYPSITDGSSGWGVPAQMLYDYKSDGTLDDKVRSLVIL